MIARLHRIVILRGMRRCVPLALAVATTLGLAADAQESGRKATTVEAIRTYPVFFHNQRIAALGRIEIDGRFARLAGEAQSVELVGLASADGAAPAGELVELRGSAWDVGRLAPDDPRVASLDLAALSEERLGKPWPGVGELVVIVVDAIAPAEPPSSPSVRALALQPSRYADQPVAVTGRFRGRNLYGDLPQSPGQSRFDFVLQSADAAVWVTGQEPRGEGFNLDVDARVDTGRWLRISGTARMARGLVWIEAEEIAVAEPDPILTEAAEESPATGPPPRVIFSMPLPDESDVSREAPVRIQFSRDMNGKSFDGRVRVSYSTAQSAERGEPQPPPLTVTTRYLEGNRVLEISFAEPLDRFRAVRVDLLEGIEAFDGARLAPWSMTFTLGGS